MVLTINPVVKITVIAYVAPPYVAVPFVHWNAQCLYLMDGVGSGAVEGVIVDFHIGQRRPGGLQLLGNKSLERLLLTSRGMEDNPISNFGEALRAMVLRTGHAVFLRGDDYEVVARPAEGTRVFLERVRQSDRTMPVVIVIAFLSRRHG